MIKKTLLILFLLVGVVYAEPIGHITSKGIQKTFNSLCPDTSPSNWERNVEKIYSFVRDIPYRSDFDDNYPGLDYWQTPEETIRENAGDCEDHSILLVSLLEELYRRTYHKEPDSIYVVYGIITRKRTCILGHGHVWVILREDKFNIPIFKNLKRFKWKGKTWIQVETLKDRSHYFDYCEIRQVFNSKNLYENQKFSGSKPIPIQIIREMPSVVLTNSKFKVNLRIKKIFPRFVLTEYPPFKIINASPQPQELSNRIQWDYWNNKRDYSIKTLSYILQAPDSTGKYEFNGEVFVGAYRPKVEGRKHIYVVSNIFSAVNLWVRGEIRLSDLVNLITECYHEKRVWDKKRRLDKSI